MSSPNDPTRSFSKGITWKTPPKLCKVSVLQKSLARIWDERKKLATIWQWIDGEDHRGEFVLTCNHGTLTPRLRRRD